MPYQGLSRFLLLPNLNLEKKVSLGRTSNLFLCSKVGEGCEICPKCAQPSSSRYDSRVISVRDEPIRGSQVVLKIKKYRYYCKTCRKPFTEPVEGIMPRRKTTQRYRRSLLWAATTFSDLSKVKQAYACSNALIYKIVYEQLELKSREIRNPWPKSIGIDEHMFSRSSPERFVTVLTDHTNRRVKETVHGKTSQSLHEQLKHIPGRENVRWITLDLSDTYKKFCFEFFPNAELIADKFHVLRLLTPHLIRRRKDIAPSRFTRKAKRLLLMSSHKLDFFDRSTIRKFLSQFPELEELYSWKERLHGFYRIKGHKRAQKALEAMILELQASILPELRTLGRTLSRWKNEVLNYFINRLTNARTEGFNNVAKLVIKRAYGYKSYRNYRLRLLSACGF